MDAATEILLIRHGETAWNAVKRLQGHLDIPLNEHGERQAAALGEWLKDEPLDAIIASDLQRAAQTAQAIAQRQGLSLQIDAGLRERCYGAFEGLKYSEIGEHYPAAYAAWQAREIDFVFPPGDRIGESTRQFQALAVTAILHHAQRYRGRKIAMVAHGGVLECAYRAARSLPLDAPRDFSILNASVNRFIVTDGALQLVAWGGVAHLDALAVQAPTLDEIDRRAA